MSDHTNCDTQRKQDVLALLFCRLASQAEKQLAILHARALDVSSSVRARALRVSRILFPPPNQHPPPSALPLPRTAPQPYTLTDKAASVRRAGVGVGVLNGCWCSRTCMGLCMGVMDLGEWEVRYR